MIKGKKIFRVIICTLLVLIILCSAFFDTLFFLHIDRNFLGEWCGVCVAGVDVTRRNKDDILGDGTVSYNKAYNALTLNNAVIEADCSVIQSLNDLRIMLVGENRLVCKDGDSLFGICVANGDIYKDLLIQGEGSLTIEFQNVTTNMQGILADNLTISSDITVTTADCENIVNGIVCGSSLLVFNKANVTVNNGAGKYSAAVRVRSNALFEEGTAMNVSVAPGSIEICKGVSINGDLILGKNTSLHVSIDDEIARIGECVRVTGLLEVDSGSTVTASAKKDHAVACYGTIVMNEEATVSATTDGECDDIFCSGAVINNGAVVNAEIEALGGVHSEY